MTSSPLMSDGAELTKSGARPQWPGDACNATGDHIGAFRRRLILVNHHHVREMMSSAYCRERAAEWSARAERAPDGKFKARFERIARNWADLARTAESEEALARKSAARWR